MNIDYGIIVFMVVLFFVSGGLFLLLFEVLKYNDAKGGLVDKNNLIDIEDCKNNGLCHPVDYWEMIEECKKCGKFL